MSNSGENCEVFYIYFFLDILKLYVNHSKLCEMANMNVEEFKLKFIKLNIGCWFYKKTFEFE
jgi:hypothetical protein